VERDAEFPIGIQEDDVIKVFVAVEANTAIALNKMDFIPTRAGAALLRLIESWRFPTQPPSCARDCVT
jgi:hypothetical protein